MTKVDKDGACGVRRIRRIRRTEFLRTHTPQPVASASVRGHSKGHTLNRSLLPPLLRIIIRSVSYFEARLLLTKFNPTSTAT